MSTSPHARASYSNRCACWKLRARWDARRPAPSGPSPCPWPALRWQLAALTPELVGKADRPLSEQVAAALEVASAQAESRRLLREADDARRALLNIIDDQRHTEATVFRFPGAQQYQLEVETFVRKAQGEDVSVFTLEDSVKNQKLIDAVFRAGTHDGWETV